MNIRQFALALAYCCTQALLAGAQQPSAWSIDPNQVQRVELTVTAAAEPKPALKYSLAIGARERSAGNAAPFYYRALLLRHGLPPEHDKRFADNQQAWVEEPLTPKTQAEIKEWLAPFHGAFRELKTAVYREHCDWDFRLQDLKGMEVIAFLLPEMQEARSLSRALRLRVRLEIADKRYGDAVETLRWGYQLARDCAEQPLLVSNLVGIAIAATMTEQLVELIEAPDSPNLYWAIASLPDPLIDVRRAFEFERGFPEQMFPFLKDAETVDRSPQEWQRVLEATVAEMGKVSTDLQMANANTPHWMQQAGLMLMIAKVYPKAKAELIAEGLDAKRVEAMSVAQVVAIQTARRTRESFDDAFKAALLPFPESLRFAAEMEASHKRQFGAGVYFGTHGLPIAQMLLPATLAVHRAEIRGPRQLAALQAVEAVRMHAAVTGKLPNSLRDISVVPVPLNPVSRLAFPYELKGNEAVLELPILAEEQPRSIGKRYVITLAK